MKLKKFFEDLLAKLEYRPIQVFMRHFQSAEMDLSAIADAYYLLVTAFPLLVIAANIFPYFHINVSDLLSLMQKNHPKNIYEPASRLAVDAFSKPSTGILGFASLTAFWTMSKSLTSLQKAINKAYGVDQHRDFVISRLVGVGTGLIILFLLTFVLIFSTFSKPVLQIIVNMYDLGDTLTAWLLNLAQPVTFLTIFLGIGILYFILPNARIRKVRYVIPGTLFSTFVIGFFSNLISQYVLNRVEKMVDIKTFGSVVIFILMLWFIFLAHIMILGAILNASVQEIATGKIESRRGDIMSLIQKSKEEK